MNRVRDAGGQRTIRRVNAEQQSCRGKHGEGIGKPPVTNAVAAVPLAPHWLE